jgi:hypothetical protein
LLGDSMVAAVQVPLDQTMSQLLEKKLNAEFGTRESRIEVLNFAVNGYSLAQEFLSLRERVWAFHPNIVILFFSSNSMPSTSRVLASITAPSPFFELRHGELVEDEQSHAPADASLSGRRRHAIVADLMNRVRLLQLSRQALGQGLPREFERIKATYLETPVRSQPSDSITESPTERMWLRPPSDPVTEEAWQVSEALLTAIDDEVKRNGAEFWISTIGIDMEDNPSPDERLAFLRSHKIADFGYSHRRIRDFAEAHHIAYISLEPRVVEYGERNHLSLRGFFNTSPNEGHWNEYGNLAACEVVAKDLTDKSSVLAALKQVTRENVRP